MQTAHGVQLKNNVPFNVVRNPNDWGNCPRDPISAAIATALTGATAATATIAWYAVYGLSTLAISAVTSAVMTALAPRPSYGSADVNSNAGLQVNARSAIQPMDFVYGQVRKGGTITFLETTGGDNKILHQIICLAGHEVEEIGDIYFNDEIVTLSGASVTSKPYNGYATVYKHRGNQTSSTTQFANSGNSLSNTLMRETGVGQKFIGRGIAYLYCRFVYNAEAYANGLPTVTAVVKGKKLTTTTNGQENAPTYSNNAAWVIRDYLTAQYGFGDVEMNAATFEAAANICDDRLDGTSIRQYQINGVVRADQTHGEVISSMMTACAGTPYWGMGEWRLHVGNFVTPIKTLTLDDFRSGIHLDTRLSMADNFNGVKGTFVDEGNGYISADYPQITDAAFLAEDNGVEAMLDLPLPFTTNGVAAQRLAKQTFYRGREQQTLSAEFGMSAFDIEVGDFIKIQNERYGWGRGNEKTFECVGWKFAPDSETGDLRIALTLRESSATAFSWSAANAQEIINNNSTLNRFYEVPSVGLEVSQLYRAVNENVSNLLRVNVTSAAPAQIEFVTVKYKRTDEPTFKIMGQGALIDGGSFARFEVSDIEVPQIGEAAINYTIAVTPVNHFGYKGDTVTTTFNVVADTTPPAAPAALDYYLSGGTIFFTWPAVSDLDLSHYRLHYSPVASHTYESNSASLSLMVEKVARPATSVSWGALSGKFFVTAVDKTGNESVGAASVVVAPTDLPELGQTETDVEATPIQLTAYSSAAQTEVYTFDHNGAGHIDVGTVRTVRLSYWLEYSRRVNGAVNGEVLWDDVPGNWDTWPHDFDDWSLEQTDFGDVDVAIQAAASVDGVTYGSWVDGSGEIVGRYIKFRAILKATNPNVTPYITALSAIVEY